MKRIVVASLFALLPAVAVGADSAPPPWAFPSIDADFVRPPETDAVLHLPGSMKGFTMKQIDDPFNPPDWYPEDHPAMPDVVAHGRMPDVRACGQCHMPHGMGHPESSSLAGQPMGYIIQQMQAFKNGTRKSSLPARSASMVTIASAATDAEVKAAAEYFSNLKQRPWVTVKEAATVPKTYVGGGSMRHVKVGAGNEPIGQRIIEVPENSERAIMRDGHTPFIAYVPPGAIKKGEALVTTGGGGKTIACGVCHGPDLKGLGDVPGIAARSPIYVVRQLYDIQHGTRSGPAVELMKQVVAKLSEEDMINIAAYTASRAP